ncbi:hypothetical protein ACFSQJ_03805 [Croceitalea marina]|uniref:Uncharacterized protein n=1 Tax=Croceitalea marina TaxID=1775166 RepID=A0ABW5MUJ2_9FLAO
MKTFATIILIIALFGILYFADFILSYGSCASAVEVLQWWWQNGGGHAAIIFFSFGLFAFVPLISKWLMLISQIIYGRPVEYVWIGSGFFRDTDYYYDLQDPEKKRFKVKKRVGEYDFNFTTSIDILYTCRHMLRYGSQPEHAERVLAHNLKSQLMLVIFQYPALVFGCLGMYEILAQHASSTDGASISYEIFKMPFLVLPIVHIVGLAIGHLALQRKIRSFKKQDNRKIKSCGLQPGDSIKVRLVKKARKRQSSGNKPFIVHYLGEWTDNEGITISIVFGFKMTWSLRDSIEKLNAIVRNRGQIECIVMPDYTIRPKILINGGNVTML